MKVAVANAGIAANPTILAPRGDPQVCPRSLGSSRHQHAAAEARVWPAA